jgi:hypothetical protein
MLDNSPATLVFFSSISALRPALEEPGLPLMRIAEPDFGLSRT